MSRKPTLAAYDPNGVKATRTTDRTYTHVVFIRKTEAKWKADLEQIAKYERQQQAKYQRVLENQNYGQFTAADYERWRDNCDKQASTAEEKLATGFQVPAWEAVNWCGRVALAISQGSSWRTKGYEAHISEVSFDALSKKVMEASK